MIEELFSVEFDENNEMNIEFEEENDDFPMTLSEGGESVGDAVRYNPQELTEEQKAQARANIGVASSEELAELTDAKMGTHNASEDAHNDIRLLIQGLTTRLNTLANSDDTTLDQMAELVTYIKANRELIESVTTAKVNVTDIVDNLTTKVSNKPLSAGQGVALKGLIDTLQTAVNNIKVPTKTSELTNDSGFLTQHQDLSAYAKKTDIPSVPTKTSQLTNDSNFLTAVPSEYVTETELTSKGYAKQTDVNNLSKEIVDLKTTITLGQHTDGLIYIFIGGVPIGDGLSISGGGIVEPVYGQPLTDSSLLKMVQGTTALLGIKLDAEPTQNQTITILNDNGVLTFDKEVLEFTTENWNEYQFVTVTAGSIEEDISTNIVLRNSDRLMTDKNIPVYVLSEGYAVDTTIPSEDMHVVTIDDFESTTASGSDKVILNNYNATYTNIYVPKTIEVDGVEKSVILKGNGTFTGNTTIKYVTIESGVYASQYGQAYNGQWVWLFKGCTNLIGVKYEGNDITSLTQSFNGCTSLKFFDGLEKQINCTDLYQTFMNCTSLEYIQDISRLTKLAGTTSGGMQQTFNNCSKLKRVFGLPTSYESPCRWHMAFMGCTQLESIEIPANTKPLSYGFSGCTSLRKAVFNGDDLTSTDIAATTFQNCTNLNVYATSGSTTYATLESVYGTSTNVIINDKSGLSKPYIVTWGDSTTSLFPAWIDWPTRLQDKVTEYIVKNQAVSGEYTTSTSARQGGNALKVGAFTIPADTSQVEITLTSTDGQTFGNSPVFSAGASFNPCTIAGVKGTISNSSGKYYFTRYEAGDSVEVSADTVVTSNVDDMMNNANNIMLIDLGTNAGWNENADTLLNQVQLMVNHFTSKGGTKYIICGASSGQFLRTEEKRNVVLEYEQKASTAFGEHWLNMREYLIANGLTENGLTASALDTERIAQGLVPASLLGGGSTTDIKMYDGKTVTDDTHPNAYGYNSKMNAFYGKGVALGYWS